MATNIHVRRAESAVILHRVGSKGFSDRYRFTTPTPKKTHIYDAVRSSLLRGPRRLKKVSARYQSLNPDCERIKRPHRKKMTSTNKKRGGSKWRTSPVVSASYVNIKSGYVEIILGGAKSYIMGG